MTKKELLNMPMVDYLYMRMGRTVDTRLVNCMRLIRFYTGINDDGAGTYYYPQKVCEFLRFDSRDFLKVRQFGRKSLGILERILAGDGFHLRASDEDIAKWMECYEGNSMPVRFRRLEDNAVMPIKAHPGDAGADLTACSFEYDEERSQIVIGSGIAVEIPEGHVGLLFPRSSIYRKDLTLSNCVGVIDSNYRGEIMARFRINKETPIDKLYMIGERFAQLIIMPYPKVSYVEADTLSDSDRGEGGYGSTGA